MQKVKIESFNLIGIAVRTTNENGQAAQDIPALWEKFRGENLMEKIPNKTEFTVYSMYTDYEGDQTKPYTTILGCKVKNLSEIPEGMVGQSFEGGDYVKMTAKGDLMQGIVINKWMEIWDMDLKRKFTGDYEVYGEKAMNPNDAEVDFFIAVK